MAGVAEQIKKVRASIPTYVTLVCVSKFHPVEAIREAEEAGDDAKVDELMRKMQALDRKRS